MFVTLTANPSVDRTVEVQRLERGGLHRASGVHVQPGGKGINVARALARNGFKSRAVVPAGGAEGAQLISLLADDGIDVVRVPVLGPVRCNITVVEPDATVTKLNEAGAPLSEAEVASLRTAVLSHLEDAAWVVAAGSLPPGAPTGFYADLVTGVPGVKVAVDSSGPALGQAVAAGAALVKPNLPELEEAVGRPLPTLADVVAAARELLAAGAGSVLASLGGHGAVLVQHDGAWHAEADAVPRSTVGAGDAMLAGYLSAGGGPEGLRAGVAWGSAAVSLPGSTMPGPAEVRAHRVRMHPQIDGARELR
ncbi:1-phosphofructokinase family hexose kinase [Actinokineospora guangxiensis]|uniref:1-phosphofructokinase family hexose kinase n=1 Tax=Actinokineospora guangxiensis TaxID=1490288 RepID=A0ABW0END7_9PSEU